MDQNSSKFIIQLLPSTRTATADDSCLENSILEGTMGNRIVQDPAYLEGHASQIIQFINKRINPLEMEPKMYLKKGNDGGDGDGDGDEDGDGDDGASQFELVASIKVRDDVRIVVNNAHLIDDLVLSIIPALNIETLVLHQDKTPKSVIPHLAEALSGHSSMKRLWLKTDSPTDINFGVAASIIKMGTSSIQDLVIEGYDSYQDDNKEEIHHNQIEFFQALEETTSIKSLTFVKTAYINIASMSKLSLSLCQNVSIQRLYLGDLTKIPKEGLLEFANNLPRMKNLQVLDVRLVHRLVFTRPNHHRSSHTMSETNVMTFFQAMAVSLQSNFSLFQIQGCRRYLKGMPVSLQNEIEHQLQLNRSQAKQFVRTPTVFPNVWSLVLASKCSNNPSAMYFCLREKVASLCTN